MDAPNHNRGTYVSISLPVDLLQRIECHVGRVAEQAHLKGFAVTRSAIIRALIEAGLTASELPK